MTLYYNQHLGMMKPILGPIRLSDRAETLAKVPSRKKAKKRMAFLDKRHLFDCPNCRRIVRWDFGADVGHRDALKYQGHGDPRQLSIPIGPEGERILKLDKYMRLCCDDCWADIDGGNEPRKGWDKMKIGDSRGKT